MKILAVCKSYFNGFNEIGNFKKNDNKTNALALLKIFSYCTGLIPLGFAVSYGVLSLCGRVSKKKTPSSQDQKVDSQAKQAFQIDPNKKINKLALRLKADLVFKDNLHSSEIVNYIQQVLNDPEFEKDPQSFMQKWKEDRGGSEEFRVEEDSARSFFKKELNCQ